MTDRPSVHKQLMFLPNFIGASLFVRIALGITGFVHFAWALGLVFLTTIPFQYTYNSLFPVEPRRLREAGVMRSILLLAGQITFWAGIFLMASHIASQRGA